MTDFQNLVFPDLLKMQNRSGMLGRIEIMGGPTLSATGRVMSGRRIAILAGPTLTGRGELTPSVKGKKERKNAF